ncbi:hypothetical protein ACFLWH_01345 [Chloroflexota bacterium]
MKEKTKTTKGNGNSIALLVTMLKSRGWSELVLANKLNVAWGRISKLEGGRDKGSPELRAILEGMLVGKC